MTRAPRTPRAPAPLPATPDPLNLNFVTVVSHALANWLHHACGGQDPATRFPGRRLEPEARIVVGTGPRVVRVALIGTGWAVRALAPAIRHAGMRITVLWGRSPESAAAGARLLNGTRVCVRVFPVKHHIIHFLPPCPHPMPR